MNEHSDNAFILQKKNVFSRHTYNPLIENTVQFLVFISNSRRAKLVSGPDTVGSLRKR